MRSTDNVKKVVMKAKVKSKFVYPDKLYARTRDNITLDISYAPQTLDAVEYVRSDVFEMKEVDLKDEASIRNELVKYLGSYSSRDFAVAKHFFELGVRIQKEEKYEVPSISKTEDVSVTSRLAMIDNDLKPIAEFILDYAHWNLHKDEWNHPVLEVPLFRVLDALIQRGKPYSGV